MSLYQLNNNGFTGLDAKTFLDEGIYEKQIHQALITEIDVISNNLMVISSEFCDWQGSNRRIDILAIDTDGKLVVIEVKRTLTGDFSDLQAIRYASMISTMTFDQVVDLNAQFKEIDRALARDNIRDFLEQSKFSDDEFSEAEINFGQDVQIYLISQEFSQELTTSVLWLRQKNIDIRCIKLNLYKFEQKFIVDVDKIIPLPEAEEYMVKLKEKKAEIDLKVKNSKDHRQFNYNNQRLGKGRLVVEVIKSMVKEKDIRTYEKFNEFFPNTLHSSKQLICDYIQANEQYQEKKRANPTASKKRFFFEKDDQIILDNNFFVISNQWGIGNIKPFIDHARDKLKLEIEEVN